MEQFPLEVNKDGFAFAELTLLLLHSVLLVQSTALNSSIGGFMVRWQAPSASHHAPYAS